MQSKFKNVMEVIEIAGFIVILIWKTEWIMFGLSLFCCFAFCGFGYMFITDAIKPWIEDTVRDASYLGRIASLWFGVILICTGIAMPMHFFGGVLGKIGRDIMRFIREIKDLPLAIIDIADSLLSLIILLLCTYGTIKKFLKNIITGRK